MEIVFRTPFAYRIIFALEIYPRFAYVQLGNHVRQFWTDYPPGCQALGIWAEERVINKALKRGRHRKPHPGRPMENVQPFQ